MSVVLKMAEYLHLGRLPP